MKACGLRRLDRYHHHFGCCPRNSLVLLAVCAVACGRGSTGDGFLNQNAGVGYVGIKACDRCHVEVASSYAHTGMGRSFYPMSARVAVEDFTRENEIEIHESGVRYRMENRDGKYWMRQFVRDSSGKESAVDEHEMVYVMGSGNHCRSYITAQAGKLMQMPVCWYPDGSLWDVCPGYEHNNDNFGREITTSCVFCHNARMEVLPGERSRYREPIPPGIDCERCHGPGQLHVERWSKGGETPTGEKDRTIVNPRRLPLELRIQVCLQCHLGDSKAAERVIRYDRSAEDYRPGRPLSDTMILFTYEDPTVSDFGLSAQADRLILSRCYKASGGKLECLTCHNPHVTVYREDRPADIFRGKCLGCHRIDACTGPQAGREATTPHDDCIACHMRKAEADDQAHAVFTDHWIRRRINIRERDARSSMAVEPVLAQDFDKLPPQDRAYYRGRANLLLSRDLPAGAARKALLDAAEASFREAIARGLEKADCRFFLGKVLTYRRQWDDAESVFREALARDPGHHDAAINLGQTLYSRRKYSEAAEVFRTVLQKTPHDPAALAELGRCEAASNRPESSLALFEEAIREEPKRAHLHSNRATTLYTLGRKPEALAAIREAVRLDPVGVTGWKALASLLLETGRLEEAAEAERRVRLLERQSDANPSDPARGMGGAAP